MPLTGAVVSGTACAIVMYRFSRDALVETARSLSLARF